MSKATVKKQRGAKKGVKRGPRQLFFVVQGMKDDVPFMDSIPGETVEEASEKFQEIHKTEPIGKILGAFYEQKGKNSSKSSATYDIDSLNLTGKNKIGEHRGFNVKVMLTEDPAVGIAFYGTPLNPDENTNKRSKPTPKPINLREIENLREATA